MGARRVVWQKRGLGWGDRWQTSPEWRHEIRSSPTQRKCRTCAGVGSLHANALNHDAQARYRLKLPIGNHEREPLGTGSGDIKRVIGAYVALVPPSQWRKGAARDTIYGPSEQVIDYHSAPLSDVCLYDRRWTILMILLFAPGTSVGPVGHSVCAGEHPSGQTT